jgi:hypothetical protein
VETSRIRGGGGGDFLGESKDESCIVGTSSGHQRANSALVVRALVVRALVVRALVVSALVVRALAAVLRRLSAVPSGLSAAMSEYALSNSRHQRLSAVIRVI